MRFILLSFAFSKIITYEVRYMSHRHFNVKFTINNVRLGVMAVTSRAMTSE